MEFMGAFLLLGILAVFHRPIRNLLRRFITAKNRNSRIALLVIGGGGLVALCCWSEWHYLFLDEPLYIAARNGNAREVKELLARGADPEATFKGPQTAMQAAQEGGHADVVEILKKAGAKR